jgi:hypothetical protein
MSAATLEKLRPGYRCPKCKSSDLAIRVETWANYSEGEPDGFDDEDLAYVEPQPERVCRNCQHTWKARS